MNPLAFSLRTFFISLSLYGIGLAVIMQVEPHRANWWIEAILLAAAAPIAINLGSPLENSRGIDRVFGLFFLLSRVGLLGFCMFVFRLLLARGNGGGGYYGSIGPALAILFGITISMTLTLFCGLVSACLKPRSSWFLLYALVLGGFVWTTVGF